jgi:hypothetical protein
MISTIGHACASMGPCQGNPSGVRGRPLPRMECFERRHWAAPPAFFAGPSVATLPVGCSTRPPKPEVCGT